MAFLPHSFLDIVVLTCCPSLFLRKKYHSFSWTWCQLSLTSDSVLGKAHQPQLWYINWVVVKTRGWNSQTSYVTTLYYFKLTGVMQNCEFFCLHRQVLPNLFELVEHPVDARKNQQWYHCREGFRIVTKFIVINELFFIVLFNTMLQTIMFGRVLYARRRCKARVLSVLFYN